MNEYMVVVTFRHLAPGQREQRFNVKGLDALWAGLAKFRSNSQVVSIRVYSQLEVIEVSRDAIR